MSIKKHKNKVKPKSTKKIVRLFDMFDGWIDITGPVTEKYALKIWNQKTNNGTQKTCYGDGDYYRIFDADTKMIVTPEFLDR
jgi:hypothetical protein